jgi:hypothetical protein
MVKTHSKKIDEEPVSTRIRRAVKDLARRPESELRTSTERWLASAVTALDARNRVLHSEPEILFNALDLENREWNEVSVLFHRQRGEAVPEVAITLSLRGLREVRVQIEAVLLEWSEVAGPLSVDPMRDT